MLLRLTILVMFLLTPFASFANSNGDLGTPKMKLLFLGATPEDGAPGVLPTDLPAITLDALPAAEDAKQTVFASRLRTSPVSTFMAEPGPDNAQFDQFFLVTDVALAGEGDTDGYHIELSGERFDLTEFADRVEALVAAFNPKHRRIGLVHMSDAGDVFPMAIDQVKTALTRTGFDMLVVMIGNGEGPACSDKEALHYSLISGLADRTPFGDGNGISTVGEVETYLTSALGRMTTRDTACGLRYSVILRSSNDPSQELVAFKGRSIFSEVETRLYNETFEARFLLASDSADDVQDFLASCEYCPHEHALTERLRDMEEFARANALEAQIWSRIQDDETPTRLEIYLDQCTLCSFESDALERIKILKAKAEAREAEALTFSDAAQARDLLTLRDYVAGCVACDHVSTARELVAEIEADEAYKAEIAELDIALEAQDVVLLKAFIDDCTICEGRDEAAVKLERLNRRISLLEPCLAAAALPQLGGPRQLTDIDQEAATRICETAAEEFPNDVEIQITQGRIAQAAGDFESANAAYAAGMEADLPSAFGLAAYMFYAPAEGGEIDLEEAERLAQLGAGKGDWLSREILTVLYSRGLVPGRTAEEAFDIAKALAAEGNAMADYFVGYYYHTGTGVEPDRLEAQTWLQKAVDQGYTLAMSYLAETYETADIPDVEKAASLYWSALQAGEATAIDKLTADISNRNREVVRKIQENLADLGAYRGPLDGIAGAGTVTAIQNFAETRRQG